MTDRLPEPAVGTEHAMKNIARFYGDRNSSWRLVCAPHAGGTAGTYGRFAHAAGESPRVVSLQYPGRETRFSEPLNQHFSEYVNEFLIPLTELASDGIPTAMLGHSFGASLIAAISDAVHVSLAVFSARRPPGTRSQSTIPRTDTEWRELLKELGGTPASLIENDEFLQYASRTLSSDLCSLSDLVSKPEEASTIAESQMRKLSGYLTIAGDSDSGAPADLVSRWRDVVPATATDYGAHIFAGGHFFLFDHVDGVVDLISEALHTQVDMGIADTR